MPPSLPWSDGWQRLAEQIDYSPQLPPAGTRFSWRHHRAYSLLMMGLYQALREDQKEPLGLSIQRFVLRLGEDGFLPDLQVFRRDRLHRLREYYFDGPADLVVEVALPGHEAQDREVKSRLYAASAHAAELMPLVELADRSHSEWGHVIVARALGELGQQHPELRDEVVALLSDVLHHAEQYEEMACTFAMDALVELEAAEALPAIRHASSWTRSTRWCAAPGATSSTSSELTRSPATRWSRAPSSATWSGASDSSPATCADS